MSLDSLGLAFCLPFFIGAIMSHLGHNFSVDHFETGDEK